LLADDGERLPIERVPDAGGKRQGALSGGRKPLNLSGHQIDDVVGDAGPGDRIHVEGPALPLVVEAHQSRFPERLQELTHEEGIAAGLPGDESGQRLGVLGFAMERVDHEVDEVRQRQGIEREPHSGDARGLQLRERTSQGMGRIDLVVAVGPDQQQRVDLGGGEQRLQQIQRRAVGPLEIVQEDDQGMLAPAEGAEEVLEDQPEAILGLRRPQGGRGRLRPQDRGHFGNHFGQHGRRAAERVAQPQPPRRDLCLVLGEQLLDQLTKCLQQGGIGHPDDLVELARDEVAAPPDQRLVELPDQRTLADTGVSGDQHQLAGPLAHPIEGRHQLGQLPLAAVEPLGNHEAVAGIAPAGRRRAELPAGFPLGLPAGEVRLEPERALIPLLRRFGQQLQHHVGEGSRKLRAQVARARRRLRDMSVYHLERIFRLERKAPGQQLVERHPQRIEVGSIVDLAVHPAGLLGRQVRDGSEELARMAQRLMLGRHARGDAEVDQRQPAGPGMDQDVAGIDVVVNDAAVVQGVEDIGELDREAEEAGEVHPSSGDQGFEAGPSRILQHECSPVAAA
jgi:hypothetical protein